MSRCAPTAETLESWIRHRASMSLGKSCGFQRKCADLQPLRHMLAFSRELDGLRGDKMQENVARAERVGAALDQCRAALARGPLLREGNNWRYGRRLFSN